MELNYKNVAIGIPLLGVINVVWIYLFSRYGLGFADMFDLNVMFRLATVSGVLLAVAIGALIAAAIFVVVFFSQRSERNESLIITAAGSAVSLVGLIFFTNKVLFLLLIAFYIASLVWLAWSRPKAPAGMFAKLGFGWNMPKKVTYLLAAGFFLAGLVFTYQDLPKYQSMVKDSMVNMSGGMTGNMNLQSIAGSMMPSKEEVRAIVASTPNFNSLTAEQQEVLVQNSYNEMQQRLSTMNQSSMLSSDKMKDVLNKVFEQIPFMNVLFQLLPVFMGILLASSWLFLESIFIAPFAALMALGLPASEELPEVEKLKEKLREKEREIAELKKK